MCVCKCMCACASKGASTSTSRVQVCVCVSTHAFHSDHEPLPAARAQSQPAPPRMSTYVYNSDHTPVGEQPAPAPAREVGMGQGSCAVANRCAGLEPCEPQYRPVSQVTSAVARGQVGGRRSAAREGARERTGLESASHRCFDRQADTYPTNECAPARAQPPYTYSGGFLPDS